MKQKRKEGFFTALPSVIKNERTMTIRKHAKELKTNKKTVRTAIKLDLSTYISPLIRLYGAF